MKKWANCSTATKTLRATWTTKNLFAPSWVVDCHFSRIQSKLSLQVITIFFLKLNTSSPTLLRIVLRIIFFLLSGHRFSSWINQIYKLNCYPLLSLLTFPNVYCRAFIYPLRKQKSSYDWCTFHNTLGASWSLCLGSSWAKFVGPDCNYFYF